MKLLIKFFLLTTILFFCNSFASAAINSAEYDSVKLNMKVYFPAKSLDKKFVITLTPRIGDYVFHEIFLMGEKGDANRNQPTINYKLGGTVNYWDARPYISSIDGHPLFIDVVVREGTMKHEVITLQIENGVEFNYRFLDSFTMCTISAVYRLVNKK